MTRLSTELCRAALKTAVKRLVAAVGGQEAAASVTRVVASKLNEYGSAQMSLRHMPVDVLLDLETCLGAPVVTAELARLQGFALLPVQLGEGDVAKALSDVARDCGQTLSDAMRALADGMPPGEIDVVCRDLAELQSAVNGAIGVLASRKAAAEAPRVRVVKDP